MSDFSLEKLNTLMAELPRETTRRVVAFAMSRAAYDALYAEFEKLPSNLGHTEINGVLTEVKSGQLTPCWAFYDLKVFRAYMAPEVPAKSLEGLEHLRLSEN